VTPGDRADLPLAEEPHLGLRPPLTGTGALGGVQPVAGPFPLEEEPALWPAATGHAPAALPQVAPRARRTAVPARQGLPATGLAVTPVGGVLLLLGAALGLRLRRLRP
jgi:hypothetical protein